MTIYFIMIGICLVVAVISSDSRLKKFAQNIFPMVILFMGFVIGMRSLNVGSDTSVYAYLYGQFSRYELVDLIGANRPYNIEVGYIAVSWFLRKISPEPTLLFLCVGLFDMFCLGKWIKRKTDNYYLALFIFICVYLPFYLTGIRQSISISIVLLASMELDKKKYVKFIILTIIASLFHMAAIITLLYIPLRLVKNRKRYFISVIIALIVLFLARISIFRNIVNLLSQTRYGDYKILNHGAPITYTIMLILLGLGGLILYGRTEMDKAIEEFDQTDYIRMITAIPVMALVSVNGSIMRIAMFFSIFMVTWIPNLIRLFTNTLIKSLVIIVSVVLLTYLFSNSISGSLYTYEFIGWSHLFEIFGR